MSRQGGGSQIKGEIMSKTSIESFRLFEEDSSGINAIDLCVEKEFEPEVHYEDDGWTKVIIKILLRKEYMEDEKNPYGWMSLYFDFWRDSTIDYLRIIAGSENNADYDFNYYEEEGGVSRTELFFTVWFPTTIETEILEFLNRVSQSVKRDVNRKIWKTNKIFDLDEIKEHLFLKDEE